MSQQQQEAHICQCCGDPADAPFTLKDGWSGPCDDCHCGSCGSKKKYDEHTDSFWCCDGPPDYDSYDVCCASDCESDCSDCYNQADKDWECDDECEYGECDCYMNTRKNCTDCFGTGWDHCDYCTAKRRILSSTHYESLSELRRMFRLNKPLVEIEAKAASKKRCSQGSSDKPGMLPQKKIRVV